MTDLCKSKNTVTVPNLTDIFSFQSVDPSWQQMLKNALALVFSDYLETLTQHPSWLPGPSKIFNAFAIPLAQTQFILFGESPYPRAESANGYAFWDAAVTELWSSTGLSKAVNRATSLRNFIKMLLVANAALSPERTQQTDIARLNLNGYIQTLEELFQNLTQHGFLLLNTSPVLDERPVRYHVQMWLPFINSILEQLHLQQKSLKLILFGKMAKLIQRLPGSASFPQIVFEHPYNLSFIQNLRAQQFFQPLQLLTR